MGYGSNSRETQVSIGSRRAGNYYTRTSISATPQPPVEATAGNQEVPAETQEDTETGT